MVMSSKNAYPFYRPFGNLPDKREAELDELVDTAYSVVFTSRPVHMTCILTADYADGTKERGVVDIDEAEILSGAHPVFIRVHNQVDLDRVFGKES